MKKRLFAILLALTLALTLLPVTAYAAADDGQSPETFRIECRNCREVRNLEIIEYIGKLDGYPANEQQHWLHTRCPVCHQEDYYLGEDHTGGTETPTCTTGKTCEKCFGEYGKLGHDWGAWQSSGDNKTHTRSCQREGCTAVDTANCSGDGAATCVTQGKCTVCGQQYYGEHTFPLRWDWRLDTDIGRDAEYHWVRCLHCEEGKAHMSTHSFSPGNMYLKSAATCISPPVYYKNCSSCYYKGTDTYVDQWGRLDPTNHDGGTEVKNAKAATCTEKGYTGDTHCKGCDEKLSDGTDTPAAGHDWAAATCTTPKTCKVCKVTEGNALGHDWGKWTVNGDGTHTRTCSRDKSHSENGKCSGGKADCCHKAKCEVCGGAYGSLASDNHSNLKHFPAKRATTHAEGNIEYWYCSGCGKYYKDAGATKEITQKDTAIRKRRSSSGSTTGDKAIESPKTGDAGIVLYIGMAALSLTGGVWLRRKEQ